MGRETSRSVGKELRYNYVMTEEKLKERLFELRNLIRDHNYRYHVQDAPIISDGEFDKLLNELRDIKDILREKNS